MRKTYLLGIDIGTSSCKAAVFTPDGSVVVSASASYPVYYPESGWAEQDPEDWWKGACEAVRGLWESGKVKPEEIAGIGIDGQSWAAVAIDGDGVVLSRTPIWMDTRAAGICDRLNREIGADRIFAVAGNRLQPSYTTPKVLWYRENLPGVYAGIDKILQCNGYLVYKLTGAVTQDICQGYGWHCFDMRNGRWDREMARELGIPAGFLPEIVPCDAVVGHVTTEAAALTGLAEGTPVVAGGLDAACGTLGAGVLHNGETQEQGGQAGGMSICTESYQADPNLILSYHVVPGRWLLQGGTVGGGGVMRWLEAQFGAYERSRVSEKGSSFDQLTELAAAVAPGSDGMVFLPYMSGERSPIWDPDAKGVLYGLDFMKTKGHVVRAMLEGTAFALRHNLETAEAAGARVDRMISVGGSANSVLWTQIKADVTGKPIAVSRSDTATTLGAAMLAGVGCGVFASYEEAVSLTARVCDEYVPNGGNAAVYDKNYRIYRSLYENLKDLMKEEAK
ncbi:MAG: FGGY-family carbohydrate kinase [Firmicutes bacterium]|nr:FGGY-family carbohydrate kinase [Bacillota bacterium]